MKFLFCISAKIFPVDFVEGFSPSQILKLFGFGQDAQKAISLGLHCSLPRSFLFCGTHSNFAAVRLTFTILKSVFDDDELLEPSGKHPQCVEEVYDD